MTIKIGFIGSGHIAGEYLSRLDRMGDQAKVVAFCDIDMQRAQSMAQGRDARVYGDYTEMLEREELDAVFDNLPPFARSDELVLAAQHGCHIFTTKPLGLNMDVARRSLEAIEEAGVISSVGYMFRYSGITDKARELLAGRPVLSFLGQVRGPSPGGWNSKRELSGGQIVEMSTHIFDLARYLGGEVRSVYALGSGGHVPQVDFEDVTTVSLSYGNGNVGTVVSGCTVKEYFWACTLLGLDLNLDLVFDVWTLRGNVDGQPVDYNDTVSGYAEQVAAFVRAVQEYDQSLVRCSYRDGLGTLATTLAAVRSLESGQPEAVEQI